ncbi:MAG: MipA/OmpV family protein, partial [Nitrospinota bacterium]
AMNMFKNKVTSYLVFGSLFTSKKYNRIFYDVDKKDSRPGRAEFHSGSGLHSVHVKFVSVLSLTDNVSLAGYLKWRDIGVGMVSGSPLIEKETDYSSGLILIWPFWGSAERAAHERLVDQADEDTL